MRPAERQYWFRPKRYGYGAEPSNWKGWLACGVYVLLVLAITLKYMVLPALEGEQFATRNITVWAIVFGASTLGFIWLCWLKTNGEWRWRWGRADNKNAIE